MKYLQWLHRVVIGVLGGCGALLIVATTQLSLAIPTIYSARLDCILKEQNNKTNKIIEY